MSTNDDLIARARNPVRHGGADHCGACHGSCGAWEGERADDPEELILALAAALEEAERKIAAALAIAAEYQPTASSNPTSEDGMRHAARYAVAARFRTALSTPAQPQEEAEAFQMRDWDTVERLQAEAEILRERASVAEQQRYQHRRKLAAVTKAWTDAGPVPQHHRREQAKLRHAWPALAKALDALTSQGNTNPERDNDA